MIVLVIGGLHPKQILSVPEGYIALSPKTNPDLLIHPIDRMKEFIEAEDRERELYVRNERRERSKPCKPAGFNAPNLKGYKHRHHN